MPPLIIAGAIAAAGAVAGGAMSASASKKAASTQAQAAEDSAQLQYQLGQKNLDFQKQQYANSMTAASPYYMSGESGLANLDYLLGLNVPNSPVINPADFAKQQFPSLTGSGSSGFTGTAAGTGIPIPGGMMSGDAALPGIGANRTGTAIAPAVPVKGTMMMPGGATPTNPGQYGTMSDLINPALGARGSLSQGFDEKFTAPTAEQARQTPGYEFQLQQGMDALNRSAAAKGGLLTGGTARDLQTFGQGLADTTYGETYNRAQNEYLNRYNIFNTNQANQYNKLASMAGLGQVQANQIANTGTNTANTVGNLLLGTGSQITNSMNNAAAARASGYVGSANAWGGAVNSGTSGVMDAYLMSKLFGGGSPNVTSGIDLSAVQSPALSSAYIG